MRLLMLGWGLDSGVDRSKMRHFLPEYFHVATPRGLMQKRGKRGESKGPMTYPLETSLDNRWETMVGSRRAD